MHLPAKTLMRHGRHGRHIEKNMKPAKRVLKKRNPLVSLALFKKAGSHVKPYKSLRGKLNREGWDF